MAMMLSIPARGGNKADRAAAIIATRNNCFNWEKVVTIKKINSDRIVPMVSSLNDIRVIAAKPIRARM